MRRLLLAVLAGALYSIPALADRDRLEANLAAVLPAGAEPPVIAESPMEGVYEVTLDGRTFYAMAQERFVLLGEVYDAQRRVSLSEERQAARMATQIDNLQIDDMVVFGPADAKRHITVFTDVDCGYCRKLHSEVPQLTDAGLQVRYLAFPRAGIGSSSYDKLVSVWCADDQQQAMTTAKAGRSIESRSCENPVADQYQLGQSVGVRGTPTLVFDDGTIVPGYLPAQALLAKVGLSPAQ